MQSGSGQLEQTAVTCPYCGEAIELLVDTSAGSQDYVEDCEVCCQPIDVRVRLDRDGDPVVEALHQDD